MNDKSNISSEVALATSSRPGLDGITLSVGSHPSREAGIEVALAIKE